MRTVAHVQRAWVTEHSELLATHEGSRDITGLRLRCPLALPVLNMRHSVQAISAQRRQKKKNHKMAAH